MSSAARLLYGRLLSNVYAKISVAKYSGSVTTISGGRKSYDIVLTLRCLAVGDFGTYCGSCDIFRQCCDSVTLTVAALRHTTVPY